MSMMRNVVVAGVLALVALSSPALGQGQRTIKIVNPFPAGGTADIWGRLLGEQVGRARGVTVLIGLTAPLFAT